MGQVSLLPGNKEGESINPAYYSVKEVGGGEVVEAEEIKEGGKTSEQRGSFISLHR